MAAHRAAGRAHRMIDASWPLERAGEAIEAIAASSRWGRTLSPPLQTSTSIERAAAAVGVEAEAVTLRYASVDGELRALGAALVLVERDRFLAVVRTDARHAHALAPDGRRVAVPLRQLRDLLCAGVEARFSPDVDRVLA